LPLCLAWCEEEERWRCVYIGKTGLFGHDFKSHRANARYGMIYHRISDILAKYGAKGRQQGRRHAIGVGAPSPAPL
jgi:hypothetical protein